MLHNHCSLGFRVFCIFSLDSWHRGAEDKSTKAAVTNKHMNGSDFTPGTSRRCQI